MVGAVVKILKPLPGRITRTIIAGSLFERCPGCTELFELTPRYPKKQPDVARIT
jgi:hypothetical protein